MNDLAISRQSSFYKAPQSIKLKVSGVESTVDVPEGHTPLLWVVRDVLDYKGPQVRMRHRTVRDLHGTSRRRRNPLVHHTRGIGGRHGDHIALAVSLVFVFDCQAKQETRFFKGGNYQQLKITLGIFGLTS